MPANFHEYAKRLSAAARRADARATDAQREANVARVGKVFCHGLELSITHPVGSVRRGTSPDGKKWARVVRHHYGYINRTTAEDGEHLDVWVGPHPDAQLAFTFDLLKPSGDHDETKAVVGVRNLREANKVISDNYPDGWLEDRVGEVRGYFMPEFKKWLQKTKVWKSAKKAAAEVADKMPGGQADRVSDSAFAKSVLRAGQLHEYEHTDDPQIAKETAKDHLVEDRDYYDKLEKMEGEKTALCRLARLV